MSQINTPPLGLQQLMGSQNFGDNPSDLAQQVIPTVDLTPFLATRKIRHKTTSGGRSDVGIISNIPIEGPSMLIGASMFLAGGLAAPDTQAMMITMSGLPTQFGTPGVEIVLKAGPRVTYAAGETPGIDWQAPTPIIVDDGVTINGRWATPTGNSGDLVQLAVWFVDLSS